VIEGGCLRVNGNIQLAVEVGVNIYVYRLYVKTFHPSAFIYCNFWFYGNLYSRIKPVSRIRNKRTLKYLTSLNCFIKSIIIHNENKRKQNNFVTFLRFLQFLRNDIVLRTPLIFLILYYYDAKFVYFIRKEFIFFIQSTLYIYIYISDLTCQSQ